IAEERRMTRRSRFLIGGGLIALMLVAPRVGLTQPASADFDKLFQAIESLTAEQKAIRNDLQEIKKLLSSRGGDDRSPVRDINTTLNVADAFSKGDKKAKLTLVEFTDYQ